MKRNSIVFVLIMFLILSLSAQNKDINGSWMVHKIISNGQTDHPYFILDFENNNNVLYMDMEVATWDYQADKSLLKLNSDVEKDFVGDCKMISLTETGMVFEKNNENWFLTKLIPEQVRIENKASGFEGTWKLIDPNKPELVKLLSFNLPSDFVLLEAEDRMENRTTGQWIFDKKAKSLILTGKPESLNGKNQLLKMSKKAFVLKNKQGQFKAKKVPQKAKALQRLTFSDKDFFDANEAYLYEADQDKLPWNDSYLMFEFLKDKKQLVYQFSTLMEDTKSFGEKDLNAEIKSNDSEVDMDCVFHGFDRNSLPDDYAMSPNILEQDYGSSFYPLNFDLFRVVVKETITVLGGTFTCTVVEAIGESETVLKLWMIDDKPGVYAKIIEDKAGMFGHYHIYELKSIQ